MNVGYKDLNCEDVGKALKLDKVTIAAWCRKGYINYIDVSEPDSSKPRYMIPRTEFDRIQGLIRKYGKRNWLMYNNPNAEMDKALADAKEVKEEVPAPAPTATVKKVQLNVSVPEQDRQYVLDECSKLNLTQGEFMHMLLNNKFKTEETVMNEEIKVVENTEVKKDKLSIDKLINRLEQIRELDDQIADLETELNQLKNERTAIRQEIIDNV